MHQHDIADRLALGVAISRMSGIGNIGHGGRSSGCNDIADLVVHWFASLLK
jgi:hypothetical protein